MKIINPLYDKAFKYLMQNNKLAKKVLSVILDVDIEEVTLGQQETIMPDEKRGLTLFRLDFKAVIKEADGNLKTVLIELQKSKYATDIQRFRNYLGANYMAKDKKTKSNKLIVEEKPSEYLPIYPIITIYILGYNLADLPYMAVTVNRDVINSVNKKKINVKSFFIEHLTHQSHIIQVRRLPEKRRTRLENFLVLFNQAWCTEEEFIIDLQDVPAEFSDVAKYLQVPVMDDNFRRQLEAEEEIDFIFDQQESKYLKLIEEERKQKEKANIQMQEANKQKEEANKQKEEANKQKEEAMIKLAIKMKKYGENIEEIIKETGLTKAQIQKINSKK